MKLTLNTPVEHLQMVGPTYAKRLKKLEIFNLKDLLHHYPHRYEDLSQFTKIISIKPGETITIKAQVISCKNIYTRSGKKIQKALVADSTGQLEITWFNQPFLTQTLKSGLKIALAGKADYYGNRLTLTSPEYEIIKNQNIDNETQAPARQHAVGGARQRAPRVDLAPLKASRNLIHTGRLVPIYHETYGVSSKWLRSRIAPLLKFIKSISPDWLPPEIIKKENFLSLSKSLTQIHFPKHHTTLSQAKKRLAFDELFLLQLSAQKRKYLWQTKTVSYQLTVNQQKVLEFINSLPFKLTSAQNRSIEDILSDLNQNQPMNRLLQGDVGSGKTVVAAIAMYVAFLNGLPSALMAPTEILALQHANTITALLKPLGVKISVQTSSKKDKLKNPDVYLGTHALLYRKLPQNLSLLIIDEQHRFGVEQRTKLLKSGKTPHLLAMTATPIPRTVALTAYAELDLSTIDEMPLGRKPVKTWVVSPKKRNSAYNWIRNQIKSQHNQAFVVCPLIEESESESLSQIKAAQKEYEYLKSDIFPDLKLDLLHGRMKSKDKQAAINQFKRKKTNILITTPVIEVGIDIPNATIIMIEGAERFGLAQLHQLRGRVGRGEAKSYCLLFPSVEKLTTLKRLKAMETNHSGFKLAQLDLRLRGPGELYGIKQHGFANLKIASFTNKQLISKTNRYAKSIIQTDPHLTKHPHLSQIINSLLEKQVSPN